MSNHFRIEFYQATIDQILGDLTYPFTLIDKRESFDEKEQSLEERSEKVDLEEVFEWAEQKVDDDEAVDILAFRHDYLARLNQARESKRKAEEEGVDWEGPTDDELDSWTNFGDVDAEFHLAWIQVRARHQPNAALTTPTTRIDDFDVSARATGELWVKHPWLKCIKRCPWPLDGLCCGWKTITKWTRIAKATVPKPGLLVTADADLNFSIDRDKHLVAIPRFRRLRLDYSFLDLIPLEALVNLMLNEDDDKIDILDPADLELDFGDIGLSYTPESLTLPASGNSLVAEIKMKRK